MELKKLTRNALLTAIALTIFMVEAQIPPLVPIPGVKLGLANIVTVFALFAYKKQDALMILLVRVFLGSVFSGQMMTLLYSLAGGLLCFGVTIFMEKSSRKSKFGLPASLEPYFTISVSSLWQLSSRPRRVLQFIFLFCWSQAFWRACSQVCAPNFCMEN